MSSEECKSSEYCIAEVDKEVPDSTDNAAVAKSCKKKKPRTRPPTIPGITGMLGITGIPLQPLVDADKLPSLKDKTGMETDIEGQDEATLIADLEVLMKGHRVMTKNYTKYRDECKRALCKQDYHLGLLYNERKHLMSDIRSLDTSCVHKRDVAQEKHLAMLCKKHRVADSDIYDEDYDITRIDIQIAKLEKYIQDEHLKMAGYYRRLDVYGKMQHRANVFENRLEQSTITFNKLLMENVDERERISHLRNERSIYNSIHKKLVIELRASKKLLVHSIETSAGYFDRRDEASGKMTSMRDRREKEITQHTTEMRDLMRVISHDQKIKEFVARKTDSRYKYKKEKEYKLKMKEKKGPAADRHLLEHYDSVYKKIAISTRQTDIKKIVEMFKFKLSNNFALYKYVNHTSNRLGDLRSEIREISHQIDNVSNSGDDITWFNMYDKVNNEVSDLNKITQIIEENDNKLMSLKVNMEELCITIQKVSQVLKCDDYNIRRIIGCTGDVNPNSLKHFVKLIEHKTNDLLRAMYYLQMRKHIMEGAMPPKLNIDLHTSLMKNQKPVAYPQYFMNDEMMNSNLDKVTLVGNVKRTLDSDHVCGEIMLTQEEIDIKPFRESAIRLKVKSTIQRNVVQVKEEFKQDELMKVIDGKRKFGAFCKTDIDKLTKMMTHDHGKSPSKKHESVEHLKE